MSWKVIQTRWLRGSNQNFSNELAEFGRKKQAFGEVKAQLNSHVEMLLKHDILDMLNDAEEAIVDENSVTFVDADDYPLYHARYDAVEIDPKPKVPKINLMKELEEILTLHSNCRYESYDYDCSIYQELEDLVNQVKEKSASRD